MCVTWYKSWKYIPPADPHCTKFVILELLYQDGIMLLLPPFGFEAEVGFETVFDPGSCFRLQVPRASHRLRPTAHLHTAACKQCDIPDQPAPHQLAY